MTAHRTVVETGPGRIRRLCCDADRSAEDDGEAVEAALDCIDDPMALVGGRPVAVNALWAELLRSAVCPGAGSYPDSVLVIHPSWWPTSRIDLVAAAARTVAGNVITRSRASALAGASRGAEPAVVVEIAARLVAITVVGTATGTTAEPRIGSPDQVAEAVQRRVVALVRGARRTAVLIDGPAGVGGAAALATMIAARLRTVCPGRAVALADETRLAAIGSPAEPGPVQPEPVEPGPTPRGGRRPRIVALAASVALSAAATVGVGSRIRNDPPPAAVAEPATFLVEGRVAIQVPAGWPVRRVTGGRGSARVEVTSPADQQVVLHLTQSADPGATLDTTAASLRRAMDRANAEGPPGVFVDFDPAGSSAGRPAVTYRELRDGRRIDWTVLIDGPVRISIGCQTRAGGADPADPVRAACDQAVRSARALS